MYVCGNRPDHVTRYTRKDTDRWLTPPAAYRPTMLATAAGSLVLVACVAALVVFGVMLLQRI